VQFVKVFYIDYGIYGWIPAEKLYKIPESVLYERWQIVACRLPGIKPLSESPNMEESEYIPKWNDEIIKELKNLAFDKTGKKRILTVSYYIGAVKKDDIYPVIVGY
jgi:hypothetical protein